MATPVFSPAYYASAVAQYCLLYEHYGMPNQILPVQRAALRLCGAKVWTLDEAMRRIDLPRRRRALDLGCAVGVVTFKMRHYFDQAVGLDYSDSLLDRSRELQRNRLTAVTWKEEGVEPRTCVIRLEDDWITEGVEFRKGDINAVPAELGVFDLVYLDKVLECLPDPARCMAQMSGLVASGGYFLNISSYRWSPEFTPPENQLGSPAQSPAQLDQLLGPDFTREHSFKVPFLLESDSVWFNYGVAEALLWKRR